MLRIKKKDVPERVIEIRVFVADDATKNVRRRVLQHRHILRRHHWPDTARPADCVDKTDRAPWKTVEVGDGELDG
jgi:hypothetical protein